MIKAFFKLIGLIIMTLIIAVATLIFVPDSIQNSIKSWGNSIIEQVQNDNTPENNSPEDNNENETSGTEKKEA